MPRTGTSRLGRPYGGTLGILNTVVPPTATAPPYSSTSLEPAIQGLITPGLVPDIARQSAEVAGARGIAGSPAGDSTAVKMSEQNYLQRLALANQLLTGEAGRKLPYDITPNQSADIALKYKALEDAKAIAQLHYGLHGVTQSGGGGGAAGNQGGPWSTNTGVTIGQAPVPNGPFTGTRPSSGDMSLTNWITGKGGFGTDTGTGDWSLDDIMASLGLSGSPFTTEGSTPVVNPYE